MKQISRLYVIHPPDWISLNSEESRSFLSPQLEILILLLFAAAWSQIKMSAAATANFQSGETVVKYLTFLFLICFALVVSWYLCLWHDMVSLIFSFIFRTRNVHLIQRENKFQNCQICKATNTHTEAPNKIFDKCLQRDTIERILKAAKKNQIAPFIVLWLLPPQ